MKAYQPEHIKKQRWIKLVSFLSILCLFFLLLLKVPDMLLSFSLAFVISYLFSPLVSYLERKGVNRTFSVVLLFTVSTLFFIISLAIMVPVISEQIIALKRETPRLLQGTANLIENFELKIQEYFGFLPELKVEDKITAMFTNITTSFFVDLPRYLSHSITTLVLAPFFAFFMLKEGNSFTKKIIDFVPNNLFELTLHLQYEINNQMGGFIRARIFEAGIVGLVVWIGLWIGDFPYAPLLGIFAAITNLIPYLGPIIGIVPAILIAMVKGTGNVSLLIAVIPYLIAQLIDIVFIIPLLVAKIVNLHPVTVIVSLIVGAQLLGVLGMVIAIPVASVVKLTSVNVYQYLLDVRSS